MGLIDIELAERILENQIVILNVLQDYKDSLYGTSIIEASNDTEQLLDKVRAIRPMVGENG